MQDPTHCIVLPVKLHSSNMTVASARLTLSLSGLFFLIHAVQALLLRALLIVGCSLLKQLGGFLV